MRIYRFSPIRDKEQLIKAVKYVAKQSTKLCKKAIGMRLPITSLTIFSHYPEEYERLIGIFVGMGSPHGENNGPRVALSEPVSASRHTIRFLRIRKPDQYRMQVGCNDFDVDNYAEFKDAYLTQHPQNLRLITRQDYEMIEFFDPDFDVLAYVVSRQI